MYLFDLLRSFAQVESSGPSFVDAGESHFFSVVAESHSGSALGRTVLSCMV